MAPGFPGAGLVQREFPREFTTEGGDLAPRLGLRREHTNVHHATRGQHKPAHMFGRGNS